MPTRTLTSKEIRTIQEALKTRSLLGYWQAGCVLNQVMEDGRRYGTGSLEQFRKKLGNTVSVSTMAHCRRLARLWNREAVEEAQRAKISFRHVIALLFFDSLAESKTGKEQDSLINVRQKLVARYATGDLNKKTMDRAILKARTNVYGRLGAGARRKVIRAARIAIDGQLERLIERIELTGQDFEKRRTELQEVARRLKQIQTKTEKIFTPK